MATLTELKKRIESVTGIQQLVVVTRDGTLLLQSGSENKTLGDYVAYIAITAEQLKPYLGFTGPYHMVMEQSSGDRILTLPGKQVIIGLNLDSHVSPTMIVDQLAPLVDQIRI